jgi:CHRD domain/RTX calcium-binding nonapeptide repeat (4 copies)
LHPSFSAFLGRVIAQVSTVCFLILKEFTMEVFDNKNHQHNSVATADPLLTPGNPSNATAPSQGASVQDATLEKALDQALAPDEKNIAPVTTSDPGDHDHGPKIAGFETHVDLNNVANSRTLDRNKVARKDSFRNDLGDRGDFLNPGGGNNVVIGGIGNDIVRGTGEGLNTITTATGNDIVILGEETTNRILDFNPATDRFALSGIDPKNIIIAQGKNPGKGGLDQPLDSVNNALIIDKRGGHILAALPFVKASDLNESHFTKLASGANQSLRDLKGEGFFEKNQRGDGKLTGTAGNDRLIGGKGDDFLYAVTDAGVKFNTARALSGETEFPFKNDSKGSTEINLSLKDGHLSVTGSYKDFNGFPLFSQGETAIAPDATILNGSDPVALINGFLKVPKDVEGNAISGTHLHFSPSEDSRGNFADATVVRYFTNTPTDATSGTITGEFNLTPVEQAALLAGDFYLNIHTNISETGKTGFPTGENRVNFNQNVVQFV